MKSEPEPEQEPDALTSLCDLLKGANMSFVFWTCPKGCQGRITWNESKTDATCEVCGLTKSKAVSMMVTPGKRHHGIWCQFCAQQGHWHDDTKCIGYAPEYRLQTYGYSTYPGEYKLTGSHPSNEGADFYKRTDVDEELAMLDAKIAELQQQLDKRSNPEKKEET